MNFVRTKLALIALAAGLSTPAFAVPCTADVENEGAKINGKSIMTTWHIRHNAARENASVRFDYRVHYRNVRDREFTESRSFSETVRGHNVQLTQSAYTGNDPAEVLSVEFNRVECRE